MSSILIGVKGFLGLDSQETVFDPDIIVGINSALMSLNQLGVGPEAGVSITTEVDEWDVLLEGATNLEAVKSYVFLKTKLLFDPPTTSYLIAATERQIAELEWRLMLQANPAPEIVEEEVP